jgi:hypothetical protein
MPDFLKLVFRNLDDFWVRAAMVLLAGMGLKGFFGGLDFDAMIWRIACIQGRECHLKWVLAL